MPRTVPRPSRRAVLAAATWNLAAIPALYGANVTWDGGGANPTWSTVNNWSTNALPATTDTVTFGSGFGSGTDISLGVPRTVDTVVFNTSQTVNVGHDYLTVTSGFVTRNSTSGSQTLNNLITPIAAGWGITNTAGGTLVLSGGLSQSGTGARNITFYGAGAVDFSLGSTNMTGGIYVNGPSVLLPIAVGFPDVHVNSGSAEFDIDLSGNGGPSVFIAGAGVAGTGALRSAAGGDFHNLTLTNNATVNVDPNVTLSAVGPLSDGGSGYTLTKSGSGTLYLGAAASNFTGPILVTSGTLSIHDDSSLGSASSISINGSHAALGLDGTFITVNRNVSFVGSALTASGQSTFSGNMTISGSVGITTSAYLTVHSNIVEPGIVSGNLTITTSAGKPLTLDGNSTYHGGTTVTAGSTLILGSSSAAGSGAINAAASGAVVQITGNATLPNAFTGTEIDAGTGDNSLGGTVTLSGSATSNVPSNASLTFAGQVTDGVSSFGLTKLGAGRLLLSAANAYDGVAIIGEGTLAISDANALGAAGVQYGSGPSTLELLGSISVSRALTLRGGTGVGGTAGVLRSSSGANTWSSAITLAPQVTQPDTYNNLIDVDAGSTLSLSGAITSVPSVGYLSKTGGGRLILSGAASYASLHIIGGPAAASTSAALAGALPVSVSAGGALELQGGTTGSGQVYLAGDGVAGGGALRSTLGTNSVSGPVHLLGNAAIGADFAAALTVSGVIDDASMSYALTKVGLGTVTLSNANTYSGGTTISGGTLRVSSNGGLGLSGTPVTLTNNATLAASASATFNRVINANDGILQAESGATITYFSAHVTGGSLRGPGTHSIGLGSTFASTTSLLGAPITQGNSTTITNFTNGGAFTNSAALTWDTGSNVATGTLNVNSTATVNNFSSGGVMNIAAGGTVSNSVTPLYLTGGSRTYVGTTAGPGGVITLSGGTTLEMNGALLANDGTVNGPVNVNYGSTARGFGTYNGTVTVSDGGVFKADSPPGEPATVATGLALTADSSIADVTSSLVIDYTGTSPLATLFPSLVAAYHGGLWDRPGITSSLAADSAGGYKTGVGYAENSVLQLGLFDGRSVDPTALLFKYTYYGDTNLDGKVNADDYARLDRGFAKHLTTWSAGDFNYDGDITSADYLLADKGFALQGAPLSPEFLAERQAEFGEGYVSTLLASVPEPSLVALLIPAAALRRRRRRI